MTLLLGSSVVRVFTSLVQVPVGPFAFSSPVTFDTHDLRFTMLPLTSKRRFIFYICTSMFSLFYQKHLFSAIFSKIDVKLSNEAILFLRILSATCTNRNRLLDSKKIVDEYLLCFT